MFALGKGSRVSLAAETSPVGSGAKQTGAERRADFAAFMFGWEESLRDEGREGNSLLFWDERRGFSRFSGGTYALSRGRANWPSLKEAGFFSEWGM